MTTGIVAGYVFHWKEFEFFDGNKADKFLVILGAKPSCNYLAVLATSRQHHKSCTPGCHAHDGYYHIPGGSKDYFPKDTWLLLAQPYEIDPAELVKKAMIEKKASHAGCLRPGLATAIVNCLRQCEDVSAAQLALV